MFEWVAVGSGVSRNREKGGHAQGGGTWPGAHTAEGRHVKMFFFSLRCWQPLSAENHLLHNGVAQVGIETEINAEAFWPFRCRF